MHCAGKKARIIPRKSDEIYIFDISTQENLVIYNIMYYSIIVND